MSVALEEKIMNAIGLTNSYIWHNGSDCVSTRTQAAKKLEAELRKRAGDSIVEPHKPLMEFAKLIADRGETSRYVLTMTWRVCASIITTHIEAAQYRGTERRNFLVSRTTEIKAAYPLPERSSEWGRKYHR